MIAFAEIDKEHCRVNLELNILLGLSREKHKNIVQILYTFRSITPDKKVTIVIEYGRQPSFLLSHAAIPILSSENMK
uniref:Protein kinase domain-containing protein n=1 Tax=Parascaris univalens TaxID=6257 RepID=A0A915A2H4_PARUN